MCVCRLKVCVCGWRGVLSFLTCAWRCSPGGDEGSPHRVSWSPSCLSSCLFLTIVDLSVCCCRWLLICSSVVALWSPLRTGLRSGDLYRGCDVTKAGRVPTGLCDIFETSEVVPDVDSSSQATGFVFIAIYRIGLLITQMETTEIRILL